MELQQRTRRFGLYVILCACILRLTVSGGWERALDWLRETVPLPIYSETGQDVRFSSSLGVLHIRESPAPWMPEPAKPVFSPEDGEKAVLDNDSSRQPDLASLLEQPLSWNLTGTAPTVLILHTHATESYRKEEEGYVETAAYRTLAEEYNMLAIGDAVAAALEEGGIGVIHDRTLHDHPSYNGSYVHARRSIQEILEEHPSVCLVLDLHRDAWETAGKQLRTEAAVAGIPSAQLMFVVGTDVSSSSHGRWQENLSLALKLQILLEEAHPGLMRPLNLRNQRFNQDLSPGALLVEVGAAGNTQAEALVAAGALAEAIISLAHGSDS